jgi:hypothetical protein
MVTTQTQATTTSHVPHADGPAPDGNDARRPDSAELFLFLHDVSTFLARNDLPA